MLQLPPMSMDMFNNIIDNIDEDYPFSLCPKLILAFLETVDICVIALGIMFIWYKRKATLSSSTMGTWLNLFLPWLVVLHHWSHCYPCYPNLPLLELHLEPHLLLPYIRLHLMNSLDHLYWYQGCKHPLQCHLQQLHNSLFNLSEDETTETRGQDTHLRVIPLNLSPLKCSIELLQTWRQRE